MTMLPFGRPKAGVLDEVSPDQGWLFDKALELMAKTRGPDRLSKDDVRWVCGMNLFDDEEAHRQYRLVLHRIDAYPWKCPKCGDTLQASGPCAGCTECCPTSGCWVCLAREPARCPGSGRRVESHVRRVRADVAEGCPVDCGDARALLAELERLRAVLAAEGIPDGLEPDDDDWGNPNGPPARDLTSQVGVCPVGREGCPGHPDTALEAGKRWRCLECGARSEVQGG